MKYVKQTCEQHFNDLCLVYLQQLSDTASSFLPLRYLIKAKKKRLACTASV